MSQGKKIIRFVLISFFYISHFFFITSSKIPHLLNLCSLLSVLNPSSLIYVFFFFFLLFCLLFQLFNIFYQLTLILSPSSFLYSYSSFKISSAFSCLVAFKIFPVVLLSLTSLVVLESSSFLRHSFSLFFRISDFILFSHCHHFSSCAFNL